MGTTVRQLMKPAGSGTTDTPALLHGEAFAAPSVARDRAGFTVEDLVIAISAGQRLRARIRRDGRFQVAGGAVAVELVGTRETVDGPRQVVCAELLVRTLASYEARPLHVLMGRAEAMPPEGIVWDITVDGSEVIRVGRQTSLVKTIQLLRTALLPRRVVI